MKSIKSLIVLALAASFASASFAASETTPPLITVPKTEEAMQATRATTARDAANDAVKPANHKTKATSAKGKSATHKTQAAPAKGKSAANKTKAAPAKGKSAANKTKATPAKGKSATGKAKAASAKVTSAKKPKTHAAK